MTAIRTGLAEELEQEFRRQRVQLARARVHQTLKDTPANRAAVAECLAHIDAILDLHVETRPLRQRPHPGANPLRGRPGRPR
jgi:hypothetical protein